MVCLAEVDWEMPHGGTYPYARRFAKDYPVLFVERPLSVLHALTRPAVLARIRNRVLANARRRAFTRVSSGLYLFRPLPMPITGLILKSRSDRYYRNLARRLLQVLRNLQVRHPVVWTLDPSSQAIRGSLGEALLIYQCTQDYGAAPLPEPVRKLRVAQEVRLATKADLVLAQTPDLVRRFSKLNQNVHLFPSCVDTELFSQALAPTTELAKDLRTIPEPRLGWIGMVSRAVDVGLLIDTARRMPDVSLVIIGGIQERNPRFPTLIEMPNVHYLGYRPHADLPLYMKGFQVGLIPYVDSEFVRGVSSVKLYEYLAAGLKVVTTAYPEVMVFRDTVWVAEDQDTFIRMVRDAVNCQDRSRTERGLAIAAANSLESRVSRMLELIDETLNRFAEK